jgi:hypothetical protein
MKKKNIKKVGESTLKTPGERLMLDISNIKYLSVGQRNIWILLEDQATKMKWSFFARRKSEMGSIVINFIKRLKINQPGSAKVIRMDNSKENVALNTRLEKEGVDIHVKFTSPNTPQRMVKSREVLQLYGAELGQCSMIQEFQRTLGTNCGRNAL